jgi:hypothetical protein
MSGLSKDIGYLKAVLAEAILDLNARTTVQKPVGEIFRDSRVLEAVSLLIAKVEALEKARE